MSVPFRTKVRLAIARMGWDVKKIVKPAYQSETSKCRPRLAPYCTGSGIDIGPGGDPIVPAAVRVDLPSPYAYVGDAPVQLAGDATDLHWFRDGVLDYVFSSHVLEDFDDTERVICEWLRVLKVGGHLVIFCPDEKVYAEHCRRTGQPHNPHHKHGEFSLKFVTDILDRLGQTEVVYSQALVDVYSWDLVARKLR